MVAIAELLIIDEIGYLPFGREQAADGRPDSSLVRVAALRNSVSSRKTNRVGSIKRCQTRYRRRWPATSGRSCSAALRDFFMPEAEPAQCVVDRREPGEDAGAARDLGLDLGEGEIRVESSVGSSSPTWS